MTSHVNVCPRCSRTGVPIIYGMPDPHLVDLAGRGEVVLGGCVIPPEPPTTTCPRCHELWGVDGTATS